MKRRLLEYLSCPGCGGKLELTGTTDGQDHVDTGRLACTQCDLECPVVRGIPRFVPAANYAANFGFQWNHFRETQLDSHTGTTITRDRFFETTAWAPEDLAGKLVLDVGCGAGRFAEVALSCGAEVVAVDFSSAVDACRENLGADPNLHVMQASVYALPFMSGAFDYVYCLGVLQHTPDVEGAFLSLVSQVKPGGRIAVDVYWANRARYAKPLTWMRPLTKKMDQERLFGLCRGMVRLLFPVSLAVGRIPGIGRRARNFVPVYNHEGVLPLSPSQLREWSLLNTYDRLSAAYETPQSPTTVQRWLDEAGLVEPEVFVRPPVVGRGRRGESPA